MMLGLLLGCPTVGMKFVDPLITAVGQAQNGNIQHRAACLEQSEILLLAFTEGRRNHLASLLISDQLRFLSVTFLLS